MKAYYQQTVAEVLEQVNGGPKPLTEEEIRARQKRWGPNALAEGRRKSLFRVFLEQFRDFLVMILIVAAIVSGFLGDLESMAVILCETPTSPELSFGTPAGCSTIMAEKSTPVRCICTGYSESVSSSIDFM